jgi:hypothetical protein
MGGNSTPKKRGLAKALHAQWIATSTGKALHEAEVARQKKLKPKPKVVK